MAVYAQDDYAVDALVREGLEETTVRRVEAAELGIVQFTDADIQREQQKSAMVRKLKEKGSYRGQRVYQKADGLVYAQVAENEERVVLPVVFWALAFKEAHDSIWSGHLRGPQTYARVAQLYWWPRMREAVHDWVAACQDCGSRKAKPKIAVPPLRSVQTGDYCDRWAIDVAGPLPRTIHGNRYVIAAVEYTTRYAVAEAVPEHTAKAIAKFLMDRVVLVYGPMREIMMDGAMEFGSNATAELLKLMQAKQATPVPYRPNLLGLVERFHRTWKDMISLYIDEEQDDWDDFVPCALYAYNSSPHATHGFQPNELMLGRKLRSPAALLRRSRLVHPHRSLETYHEMLLQDLSTARELAAIALQKEQARQAMYYNRRTSQHLPFRSNQLVWVYRPARGPKITKFGHRWRGPAQVIETTGYDNYLVRMLDTGKELVTHCSFLLSYYYPTHLLDQMAEDMELDLRDEAIAAADIDSEDEDATADETAATEPAEASQDPAPESAQDILATLSGIAAENADDSSEPTTIVTGGKDRRGQAREDAPARRPAGIAENAADRTDRLQNQEADAAQTPQPTTGKRKRHTTPAAEADKQIEQQPDGVGDAAERRLRQTQARTPADGQKQHIASRNRARMREAAYRHTDEASFPERSSSPSRAFAPLTVLAGRDSVREQSAAANADERAVHEDASAGTPSTANKQPAAENAAATAIRNAEEEGHDARRRREIPDSADDEPIIYVFAGQGRRGVGSLVFTHPRLSRLQPNESVRECRRRRYRTRTGRYVLEFQVERLTDRPTGDSRMWINFRDYEQLWREGRVQSDEPEAVTSPME
ncbi:hypothetical protein PF006_g29351 [Phytophthora fragariae]|uniref:Integrase catalytic domain-containing protein n=1 Tax=Phytophthora fragariae TaxID=53985 RepID=A0A6A3Q7Y1_9STRA|nr:hypothetical protein PF006_g29351 [Phytophthora fragariae]